MHLNFDITGYDCVHLYGNKAFNTRKGRFSGGITIYYKQYLHKYVNVVETHQNGIVWLELSKSLFDSNENVYLCCTYMPPYNSTVIDTNSFDFFEEIESGIERYKTKGKCFIFGDFNCRTSNASDILKYDEFIDHDPYLSNLSNYINIPARTSRDKVIDNPGKRLIQFCLSTSYIIGNSRLHNDQGIGDYTFHSSQGSSVVDYLLLHIDDFDSISDFNIITPNEFSDHSGIHFSIPVKNQNHPHEKKYEEKFLKFDETKVLQFYESIASKREDLFNLTQKINDYNENINTISQTFIDILSECSHTVFGKTRLTSNISISKNLNKKQWFNAECYAARARFKKSRNAFVRNKTSDQLRTEYVNAKKSYNKIKRAQKKMYNFYERDNLNKMSKTQPRKFWNKIRQQYAKNTKKAETLTTDDLYEHFKSLYSTDTVNENVTFDQNIIDEDLDKEISITEVEKADFSQNNNKSSGVDTLISEIYKCSYHETSQFILKLFNRIFLTGEYPEAWGSGIIIPIYKGGDVESAKNYRGITLINIIAKIYSQVLLNRLTAWSIKHKKIIDNQYGFQKGKSTIDCIFILHSVIAKTLSTKKKLYVAYVDFEKCFDKLERSYIFHKLIQEKVSSKFVNAIQSMYSSVKAAVNYNKQLSPSFDSNIGAKQGDPSSSLLFLFFVNDLINNINRNIEGLFSLNDLQLYMLLFADDTALFAHTPEALQSMLNDLQMYCQTWSLKVNTAKTKIMIFEQGRHTNHIFKFNDQPLETVQSFKYLGIYLFKNGHCYRTQNHLAQHSLFALHNLFTVYNQLDLKIKDKCKLFDTLVAPILHYGAEVFGFNEGKSIEKVHCKFLRKVLCVRKSTNLDAVYGELGRYPLAIHRKIIMIKYWFKILNLDNNCILKKIYNMLKEDADNGLSYNNKNWAFHIKTMLNQIGMSNVWLQQNAETINIQIIKLRILDIYKQSWYTNINNSSRLESYSLHKHTFELEQYLNVINKDKHRIALTKFRVSSHNLEIEKGRHENTPRENRKCRNCPLNLIETEYHFLLVCPKYYNLRRKFLKPYFCRWPTLQKYETLLSSTNVKSLNNLASYLYYAFNERM